MKNIYFYLILFAVGLFSACSESEFEEPQSSFEIVKTAYGDDYRGSSGEIVVDNEGVKAEYDAEWLKISQNGKIFNLSIDENMSYESRTALIRLSLEGTVREVAITQLGIISIVEVHSHSFGYEGGEVSFLWNSSLPFEISGCDESWLTYHKVDDKMVFTAAPIDPAEDSRSCVVNVSVGLYKASFTISQITPDLTYAQILGHYRMDYVYNVNDNQVKSQEVEIIANVEGESFILKSFLPDIELKYDHELPGFIINTPQTYYVDNQEVILAVSAGGWNDNWYLAWGDDRYMVSSWNGSKTSPAFQMVDNGLPWDTDDGPAEKHGFIFWKKDGGVFKGFAISSFCEINFTKL